ncbi:MAG: hemoglobin-like protein [Gammaproteobacteria bacterium]
MSNIFDQLGGLSAIKSLVNEFYDVMESDPCAKELRDLHPKKLISTRKNLYRFFSHWFGGPEIFNEKYINGEWLELRHSRVEFSESLIQQWIYCMQTALINLNVENEVKDNVMSAFKRMIEDIKVVRNSLK